MSASVEIRHLIRNVVLRARSPNIEEISADIQRLSVKSIPTPYEFVLVAIQTVL